MERVEIEGQVATAHTMAMLFSAIPPSRSGAVDIFIVDIHALQERFYAITTPHRHRIELLENLMATSPDEA